MKTSCLLWRYCVYRVLSIDKKNAFATDACGQIYNIIGHLVAFFRVLNEYSAATNWKLLYNPPHSAFISQLRLIVFCKKQSPISKFGLNFAVFIDCNLESVSLKGYFNFRTLQVLSGKILIKGKINFLG